MNKRILLSSIYAVACLSACTSKEEVKQEESKFPVTSPLVTDTSYTSEYVAEIQSLQNVEIHAKVKGYVDAILVDEGQHVDAGQVLFTIRPNEFEAELMKAKAETRSAELETQNAKTLAEKNIISSTELALAEARLEQAKAEQALAELELSYTQVKAPFEGTIDRILFKAGSLVDEETLLTTLSNNKEVYAYFNVSEAEYLNYKSRTDNAEKNSVSLILANGQMHKYKGTIQTIEGEFDKNTGSIAFRAKFPNPDLLLKHGETGKVQLTNELKNALLIPQKATFESQDRINVFAVDKNNVARLRTISIKRALPNLYAVESGLSANDKILLDGTQNINEGDKIEPEIVPVREAIAQLQLIKQQ